MSENLPSVIGGAIMPADAVRAQGKAFKEYLEAVREFVRDVLTEGIEADYGKIPGTKRLTLLQPGADKLCGLFSFVPKFLLEDRTEDKETGRYDVRYRCELYRGDVKVGEAVAFASSFESKWRYRFGSRKCPNCGGDTIRRSKFAPRGGGEPGWYCSDKGCGGQFAVNDPAITEQQEVGKITNVDIVDVFNTVEQVCQKRAKVAAVRNATRLTDMFTQDVGDPENRKGEDGADVPYRPEDATHTTDRKPSGNGKAPSDFMAELEKITPDMTASGRKVLVNETGRELYGKKWVNAWADYPRTTDGPFNAEQQAGLLATVEDRAKKGDK